MYADRFDRPTRPDVSDRSDTSVSGFVAKHLGKFLSPVLLLGYMVSFVVIGVIFVNALLLQPSNFSVPLYLTSESPPTSAPTPTPVLVSSTPTPTPTPKLTSTPTPKPTFKPVSVSTDILREIQVELLSRGYYSGDIDGEYGERTRDAIILFERTHSLPETGVASDVLLGRLLLASSSIDGSPPVIVGFPSRVAVPRSRLVPDTDTISTLSIDNSELVSRIQLGLRNYGYDDVEVDGRSGERTKTAIQRFELEYGMTITGEPTVEVLDKLRQIGAYTQG